MRGRLRGLSSGFLLGTSLEELLQFHIVLARFGQQWRWILLGQQAHLRERAERDRHWRFVDLWRNTRGFRWSFKEVKSADSVTPDLLARFTFSVLTLILFSYQHVSSG